MTKIVLCLAFFVHVTASAQEFRVAGQALNRTVKGAPYSAQAVSETVQELSDGNRITHSNLTMLYRDSEGRERREESLGTSAAGAETSQMITIFDPVEGVRYAANTQSKTVRKTSVPGPNAVAAGSSAVPITIPDIINAPVSPVMMTSSQGDGQITQIRIDPKKEEELGTQMMEGVAVKGTRTTITIPVGAFGNERPIVTVNERWYSPELQILVMSTRSDPRTGTTTYKVTNINRAEQPRTLFEPPADYKVIDLTGYKSMGAKPEEQ